MDENLLPLMFWTVSRCICESLPDSWVLTWVSDEASLKKREFFRNLLRMSQHVFAALQARFDDLLQDDRFGFPNVFFDLDPARDFYTRYLQRLPDVKLLSIALPEIYWAEFKEFTPPDGAAENGVRKKLRERKMLESEALFRGFEILGYDCASFCSFVCNSLEGEYHTKLGITFNSNGLIDDYEHAVRAADFTMLDEVGAEPLLWRPWLVSEYPLTTQGGTIT
jgi:hypothetical protein